MASVERGRHTHDHDGELAVFLIGFRVNTVWKLSAWLPVLTAMRPMLRELLADRSSGFLGHRTTLSWRGVTMTQYWRGVDDIYRYATDPHRAHRPAWQRFNARARRSGGAVGIWHETYHVPAGGHESRYVDMPRTGLARATASTPVAATPARAHRRTAGATGPVTT